MPRANRYSLPGHVWHITHRCHKKDFLLKFAKDRQRLLYWLYQAKKRYGLCVLNYIVTSNHIHLLIKDTGGSVISRSLQLIAGRTGQEYNKRKGRKGAYWEDRYHATAVESNTHLFKCLVYIDLNMVRAGVVSHPDEWAHGGYREIQHPPERYRIIDIPALMKLTATTTIKDLQNQHREKINQELLHNALDRNAKWTQTIAVGSKAFVDQVIASLGIKAKYREIIKDESSYYIKEKQISYNVSFTGEIDDLRIENSIKWDVF